jgi:uroporphyrinogen-III synthase
LRPARAALAGRRVLVTRDEPRQGPLSTGLRACGAQVVHWPVHRVRYLRSRELRSLVKSLSTYDWLLFASAHAVEALAAVGGRGTSRHSARPAVAVVGDSTAAAARAAGWRVSLVPRLASATGLARALIARAVRGQRIAMPVSAAALPTLPTRLRRAGALVDVRIAYTLAPSRRSPQSLRAELARGVHYVTFTSPSGVDGLATLLGRTKFARLLERSAAAVIGGTTRLALARRGGSAAIVARPTTLDGLVRSIARRELHRARQAGEQR